MAEVPMAAGATSERPLIKYMFILFMARLSMDLMVYFVKMLVGFEYQVFYAEKLISKYIFLVSIDK